MSVETVDIGEAQAHLKELVTRVKEGAEIILSDNEKPVAQLVPVKGRIPGLHAGSISTSEDFDAPLPDEFWAGGK